MEKTKNKIHIKKATINDKESLLSLIDALADYEKLQRPSKEARERLIRDAFGVDPKVDVYLAECEGKAVGYVFYLFTYSSFLGKSTLYLEDIFVLPDYRSSGIGKLLFKHLAKVALDKGCGRIEFMVLDWNKPAIDFYDKIGATHIKEWLPYRLDEKKLEKLLEDI